MIREYLEWHSHEVRAEFGDCPHNRQALQFSGRVRLFSLIQSPRSATDDALLAFPRPAVEASVYSRNAWLKLGKAVIGLVVSRVFS